VNDRPTPRDPAPASGPAPALVAAWHRLRGRGRLEARGEGELALTLRGEGTVLVRALRRTAFHFEPLPGERATHGARRFPDPDTLVVTGGRGVLRLRACALDVVVEGPVELAATGLLDLRLDGAGAWRLPDGEERGWGLRPRSVKIAP
jgi:hypothetical protein